MSCLLPLYVKVVKCYDMVYKQSQRSDFDAWAEREVMWIRFHSKKLYVIKIYVEGVNAVSGEPAVETAATRLRRANLLRQAKPIQDYIVVPNQLWLDGIATSDGKVQQFVAMQVGSGYSVEAQVTGEEVAGGVQFEITPANILLQIRIATGRYQNGWQTDEVTDDVKSSDTLGELKQRLQLDKRLDFWTTDDLRTTGGIPEGT